MITFIKTVVFRYLKIWAFWILTGFFIGMWIGQSTEKTKVYNDCRYAGVIRIDKAAFKCDQFSKVVLLTPEEQAAK